MQGLLQTLHPARWVKIMKFQMKLLWRTPAFWLTMGLMCLLSVGVFCLLSLPIYGMEFIAVPSADKMYIGRGKLDVTYILRALLPLVVTLPFADSYFSEKKKNLLPVLLTKYKTPASYYFSKSAAVFVSAALVVFVPFLLNMLLNLIAFPFTSLGEGTNLSTDYAAYYVEPYINNALFPRLLVLHPYLYNILFCIAISGFAGLLGTAAYILSYFVKRSRIWVLVSVFIANNFLTLLSEMVEPKVNFAFFNYLFAYDVSEGKKLWVFFLLLAVVLAVLAVLSRRAVLKLDNVFCEVGGAKK